MRRDKQNPSTGAVRRRAELVQVLCSQLQWDYVLLSAAAKWYHRTRSATLCCISADTADIIAAAATATPALQFTKHCDGELCNEAASKNELTLSFSRSHARSLFHTLGRSLLVS